MLARSSNDQVVEPILDQLRDGVLIDPRALDRRQQPFKVFIRAEIARSIERVRHDHPRVPTMAEINAAKKALDALLGTVAANEQLRSLHAWLGRLSRGRRTPADKVGAAKYSLANEAFFLIETFCETQPTGTEGGPFRTIAELLHESATSQPGADMKRACDRVLQDVRELRSGTLRSAKRP
jgi:hypothetical protein